MLAASPLFRASVSKSLDTPGQWTMTLRQATAYGGITITEHRYATRRAATLDACTGAYVHSLDYALWPVEQLVARF